MPDFDELFDNTKRDYIVYNGDHLYRVYRLTIPNKCTISIRFVSTNSEWKQGIRLNVDGNFTFEKNQLGKKIILWEDTAASEDTLLSVTSKEGLLRIYNVWDYGNGSIESWRFGAAMKIEEISGGKRYYCNDGHSDEDFDDLIFEVEILESQK